MWKDFRFILGIVFLFFVNHYFVPNLSLQNWKTINPNKICFIILLMTSFEYAASFLSRYFRHKSFYLLFGFLGGLASSTLIAIYSAKKAKTAHNWSAYLGIVLAAQISSYAELLFICYFMSYELFLASIWVLCALILIACCAMAYLNQKYKTSFVSDVPQAEVSIYSIFKLSSLVVIILFAFEWGTSVLGANGSNLLAFISGFFELHAMAIAVANSYNQGVGSLEAGIMALGFALLASLISKTILAFILNHGLYSWILALINTISIAFVFIYYYLFI